jgi:pimeloyl-ACP methyl ester carboxylesterase
VTAAPAATATAGVESDSVPVYTGPLPELPSDPPPWPGRVLRAGGVSLHVRETSRIDGDGPDGGSVVYLHGLNGSATHFTHLAALVRARLPGIAVDLPGFGRTEPLDGFDYTPDSYAEVLGDFLAGLGRGPQHLVANSLGGAVAMLLAADRPELVRTLTLLAPAMPDLRLDPRRLSDPRLALAFLPVIGPRLRRRLTPAQRVEQTLRQCFAEPSAVSEQWRARVEAEVAERRQLAWADTALGRSTEGLMRSWLTPRGRSLWRVAAEVAHPALVVWGSQDRLVGVCKAPRTVRALPRGRLLVLPRTGHVPQLERPIPVARALLGMAEAQGRGEW